MLLINSVSVHDLGCNRDTGDHQITVCALTTVIVFWFLELMFSVYSSFSLCLSLVCIFYLVSSCYGRHCLVNNIWKLFHIFAFYNICVLEVTGKLYYTYMYV